IEVKTGDVLEPESEPKQLRASRETAAVERAALVPTFLGAHEVAPEFRDRRADYVRLVSEEMIPAVARQHLATACDVFCEPGVFDVVETRTILTAAQRHGLRLKLHADELEGSGGAELAAALGALAADRGQIASGFRADLVAWSVSDWREVAYWMGGQLVTAVWTGGSACPLPAGPVSLGLHVKA